MSLHQRGDEFVIRVGRHELMNSRSHTSEDVLGELAIRETTYTQAPAVLIGGLGMGFTLASALQSLPRAGTILVAELVPQVIAWNRDLFSSLPNSGPSTKGLEDPRVSIYEGDVGAQILGASKKWDAILLDIDNGPEGLTQSENDGLYSLGGLKKAKRALRKGGILAIWSASLDGPFEARLRQAGFKVRTEAVRAHGKKGRRHFIWVARRS